MFLTIKLENYYECLIELFFIEKLELTKYYFKKTQYQIICFNNIKNTKSETNLAKNQFQA